MPTAIAPSPRKENHRWRSSNKTHPVTPDKFLILIMISK
jgi:hypothetical protein